MGTLVAELRSSGNAAHLLPSKMRQPDLFYTARNNDPFTQMVDRIKAIVGTRNTEVRDGCNTTMPRWRSDPASNRIL